MIRNTCPVTVYVRLEWPNGNYSHITLASGAEHWINLSGLPGPCGCWSKSYTPAKCASPCTPMEAGYGYETC